MAFENIFQWILATILIFSSLAVLLLNNPVHASLSFLLSLLCLASLYLDLGAQLISVLQVLVYAGAILVIFMFVIVLFQDAHYQLSLEKSKSPPALLLLAIAGFVFSLIALGRFLTEFKAPKTLPEDYGTAQSLGKTLYIDFFFPFEAIILIFLMALVGALYIGKREA